MASVRKSVRTVFKFIQIYRVFALKESTCYPSERLEIDYPESSPPGADVFSIQQQVFKVELQKQSLGEYPLDTDVEITISLAKKLLSFVIIRAQIVLRHNPQIIPKPEICSEEEGDVLILVIIFQTIIYSPVKSDWHLAGSIAFAHHRVESLRLVIISIQAVVESSVSLRFKADGESRKSPALIYQSVSGGKLYSGIPIRISLTDHVLPPKGHAYHKPSHQSDIQAEYDSTLRKHSDVEIEAGPGQKSGCGAIDQPSGLQQVHRRCFGDRLAFLCEYRHVKHKQK
jgi:hypothetical protein